MVLRTNRAILLLLVLAAAHAGGCASRGEKMVQSFSRTRARVAQAQTHVEQTMAALTNVRHARADNVSAAVRSYREAVDQLEKEGKDAKQRATTMQEEADAHVKAWQKEMATIKDPMIRSSLESRREAVRTNFKLVQMYAQDARTAYDPCLRRNKEIVQALSIDQSPATIASLAPAMDSVMADLDGLRLKLAAMQNALNNIANGVSPLGEFK
jgi:chromosome segregation ATPase